MTRSSKARQALLALLVTFVMNFAGCSAATPDPGPSPRPVTTEEAQLLAIARFTNFDTGSREFSTTLVQAATELTLHGWVDYSSGVGYASVTGGFDPQALLWTATTVGIIPQAPDAVGLPRLPIPSFADAAWQSHPIDPATSALDTALVVIGNLGQDRPDNPLLVQQSGALWLRADTIAGVPVTVFAAPPSDEPVAAGASLPRSTLRLWVDAKGLILRAELLLNDQWTTVEFPDVSAPRLVLPDSGDG